MKIIRRVFRPADYFESYPVQPEIVDSGIKESVLIVIPCRRVQLPRLSDSLPTLHGLISNG